MKKFREKQEAQKKSISLETGIYGFTLAEVLITLGIIGTVAMMTIPNLILEQKKKSTVVAVKKIYSMLSQASLMVMAENGKVSSWGVQDGSMDDTNKVFSFYEPHLKVTKDCGSNGAIKDCWERTSSLASGTANWAYDHAEGWQVRVFQLIDGTNISLDLFSDPSDLGVDNLSNVPVFFVDINGNKGPNQFGKDVFAFILTDRGLISAGKDNGATHCSTTDKTILSGTGCAAKVLFENEISYY